MLKYIMNIDVSHLIQRLNQSSRPETETSEILAELRTYAGRLQQLAQAKQHLSFMKVEEKDAVIAEYKELKRQFMHGLTRLGLSLLDKADLDYIWATMINQKLDQNISLATINGRVDLNILFDMFSEDFIWVLNQTALENIQTSHPDLADLYQSYIRQSELAQLWHKGYNSGVVGVKMNIYCMRSALEDTLKIPVSTNPVELRSYFLERLSAYKTKLLIPIAMSPGTLIGQRNITQTFFEEKADSKVQLFQSAQEMIAAANEDGIDEYFRNLTSELSIRGKSRFSSEIVNELQRITSVEDKQRILSTYAKQLFEVMKSDRFGYDTLPQAAIRAIQELNGHPVAKLISKEDAVLDLYEALLYALFHPHTAKCMMDHEYQSVKPEFVAAIVDADAPPTIEELLDYVWTEQKLRKRELVSAVKACPAAVIKLQNSRYGVTMIDIMFNAMEQILTHDLVWEKISTKGWY